MLKPILLVGSVAVPALVLATWNGTRESQADPLDEATISLDAARQTALDAVPGGRIVEEEMEREAGRLIHAFDIVGPGDGTTRDVEVDALSGALLQNVLDDDEHDFDDEDDDRDDDDLPADDLDDRDDL